MKDPWPYYEDNGFDELEEDIETDENEDDETYDRKGRKRKTPAKKSKVSSYLFILIRWHWLVIREKQTHDLNRAFNRNI